MPRIFKVLSESKAVDALPAETCGGSFQRLVGLLLDEQWHGKCEIISDYMPPFPGKDTRPSVQVRYNDGTKYPPFLRYSKGPKQGFFWDIYGDDMQCVELAVIALSKAPYPRGVGPITFTIPLRQPNDEASHGGKSNTSKL